MLVDRIFALLAYALLAGFLGIIAIKVHRIDLYVACLVGLGLAGYDMWRSLFRGDR
ncbi:MAG: hypothetical protein ABJG86_01510 [Nitratireductor sp.]|uniref:hypothetical protein n=1 Tax=Alphaproteobacteria TaxID=28211 RepID=UPI0018D21423|nr:hypothetical protein [Nitratireductor arenosus]